MIGAWVPALVHRHPTFSRPRQFNHLRAQSPHATSFPQICRTRSGTSMTKNSIDCYPRWLPSRSDGARSSLLKCPASSASMWSPTVWHRES